MDYNLPGSSVHGILQARIQEWASMSSQGIFLTQGSNSHLLRFLHCGWILHHWSTEESPFVNSLFHLFQRQGPSVDIQKDLRTLALPISQSYSLQKTSKPVKQEDNCPPTPPPYLQLVCFPSALFLTAVTLTLLLFQWPDYSLAPAVMGAQQWVWRTQNQIAIIKAIHTCNSLGHKNHKQVIFKSTLWWRGCQRGSSFSNYDYIMQVA